MKTFNSFNEAFTWANNKIEKASKEVLEELTKEVYKDSKDYTYIDTQTMYDSGENSDFENGYILIKAPQVRWLYYTEGINAGKGNPQAVPMWFERTKTENLNKYKKMIIDQIEKE